MLKQKITSLKKDIVEYARLVSDMITRCSNDLIRKDGADLKTIIETLEPKANYLEAVMEEHCISAIAQFEPKAKDLRTVLMILKISNDLERMADHAVNMAESSLYLIDLPPVKPLIDIPRMAEIIDKMLNDSILSFIEEDVALARSVCRLDDSVDELRDQIYRELITYMSADPSTIERAMHLMRISRNLERVADLCTNFCEDVIFIVNGKVIKHHFDESSDLKS